MNKIVVKKENGEIRIINADLELLHYLESTATNPCINCEKGYVNKCQKMADGSKKNIARYDFITDGYQINNEDGELLNLVVCECTNFEQDKERPKAKTKEQIAALNYLKESIKILYFGGVDINEADRIQDYQVRQNQIADVESPDAHREFMKSLVR